MIRPKYEVARAPVRVAEAVRSAMAVAVTLLAPGSVLAAGTVPSASEVTTKVAECRAPSAAFIGVTIVDGNGSPPTLDSTLVVCNGRIMALGPRRKVKVPGNVRRIQGAGKYLTPGFIDTNVHMVLNPPHHRLLHEEDELVSEGLATAQRYLRHGITTLRDTHGALRPTLRIRDLINSGKASGPRLLVAGNVIGWGGAPSLTFGGMSGGVVTAEQREANLRQTQGVGEELVYFDAEELRIRINRYLDKGVDFIKYGGTSHTVPDLILFSQAAQTALVDAAHSRGKLVSTHCGTIEAVRMCVEAGVDVLQHASTLRRPMSAELANLIVKRGVICSLRPSTRHYYRAKISMYESRPEVTQGEATAFRKRWEQLLRDSPDADWDEHANPIENKAGYREYRVLEFNARTLIRAGCTVAVETDGFQDTGVMTLAAIESLVELGMTPSQAIVAATRNGALAAGGLAEYGTLEVGKRADILMLGADPTADIRNIRRLELVMRDGHIVPHAPGAEAP